MSGEIIIPIVAVAGFFSSIILFVYLFFSSRHKERMALIQSGQDASIFKKSDSSNIQNVLKIGLVGFLSGVGILLGHMMERAGLPGVVAYFSMILILASFGLVLFYWYFQNKQSEEESKETDLL